MHALEIADGTVRVVDRPAPEPGPGDALVDVTLAGICGTDIELRAGYKGFRGVPGHEIVGVVARADDAPELIGKRVAASINAGCGACAVCRDAGPEHCPARRVLGISGMDGGMAECVVVPVRCLHEVPAAVSDTRAVFAEPLAAACRIPEQVRVGDGMRAVVVGAGRLGALCASVLRLHGARVEAVARNPRVRVVLDAVGVRCLEDAADVLPGADLVVDATGAREGPELARRLVRPRGTLVLKSTCAGGGAALDTTALVVDEITVVGSRCGPLDVALSLLAERAIDPEPLIDDVLPLSEGVHAFDLAARSGALKILLAPDR